MPLTKVGSEFLVNTETAGFQIEPTITSLTDGGFVVTWEDHSGTLGDSDGTSIKAQVFGAGGTKVGSEFLVNTQTASYQYSPTITGLTNGGFVVTWQDWSGTLGDGDGTSIKAQMFDAGGTKVGSEFLVNTETAGFQIEPTITSLTDGGFVVTWTDTSGTLGDGSLTSIKAQMFDAGGTKVGSEFLVNTQTESSQSRPTIAGLANGGFVVTWTDTSGTLGDGSLTSIKAQVFGAGGTKVGSEFLVNTQTASWQLAPTITGLADDGFVVTWFDGSGTLGDSDGTSIKAQVFDAGGIKVGSEFLVNTQTASTQELPTITGLTNGGFVVTWQDWSGTLSDSDGTSIIKAQVFGAGGTKVGSEFLVNTWTANGQYTPTVTGLTNGGFVITWTDSSGTLGDGDGTSIKAQMFGFGDEQAPSLASTTPADDAASVAVGANLVLTFDEAVKAGAGNFEIHRSDGSLFRSIAVGDASQVTFSADGTVVTIDPSVNLTPGTGYYVTLASGVIEDLAGNAFAGISDPDDFNFRSAGPAGSSSGIFDAEGKLGFLANLSLAAYHLAPGRIAYDATAGFYIVLAERVGDTSNDEESAGARRAYGEVSSQLSLLDANDLPPLLPVETSDQDFPVWGIQDGIYVSSNAAALVGRSDDALFVAFRGSNDGHGNALFGSPDMQHWLPANKDAHFNLFNPLVAALDAYLEANLPITKVFVTGHSLGAAMVQPFLAAAKPLFGNVTFQAATFGTPGYGPIGHYADTRITNFWTDDDKIGLVTPFTGVAGEFNTLRDGIFDSFWPNENDHSLELYLAIVRFMHSEGVDLDETRSLNGINYDSFVMKVTAGPAGTYIVGAFADVLRGADTFIFTSNDLILGGAGNDTLSGLGGRDTLFGGANNDILNGGAGADFLFGGAGTDRLIGSAAIDRLTGGLGADRFIFNAPGETLPASRDVITDFRRAQGDKINLSGIDANSSLLAFGNQDFKWIGAQPFHKRAGELHYRDIGAHVIAEGDVNGDGKPDFQIVVMNMAALARADFLGVIVPPAMSSVASSSATSGDWLFHPGLSV